MVSPQETPPIDSPARRRGPRALAAVMATLVAALLFVLGTRVHPAGIVDSLGLSDETPDTLMAAAGLLLVVASVIAGALALLIAGVMSACGSPFREALSSSYCILLLISASLFCFVSIRSRVDKPAPSAVPGGGGSEDTRQAILGLEDDLRRLRQAIDGPNGPPQKLDVQFEQKTGATDEAGILRQQLQAHLRDAIALQNEYADQLSKDGIDRLLDPERIDQDLEFHESRETLRRVRETVQRYRAKSIKQLTEFPDRWADRSLDPSQRKSILRDSETTMKKQLPMIEEQWDIEQDSVKHMADLIDHLEATRDRWRHIDGMFAFDEDRDLEQFNRIMARIQAGIARQDEIRKGLFESADNNLDSLREQFGIEQ